MKKSLIIGMLIAVTCQMSLAAGPKGVEAVRKTMTEELSRAGEKIPQGADAKAALARIIQNLGNTLSRVAKNADEIELRAALGRRISVGDKSVALLDIGQSLLKADQAINKINRNDLDAAGKAHLDLVRETIQVSTEFLGLANRTSDMGSAMSEQRTLEVKAFNKQLALIPKMLTEMDTADMKSHTEFMRKSVAARVSPEMNGDQAMASVMNDNGKGGKKSAEDYFEYLRRLADCQ